MNHDPISRATPGGDATDRRTGVGGLLRASRLRCGEELDVIADVLRIRRRHLQAIEDGDFDQLPGTTYAVGFIRAYADYLGLDSDEVVRRFKDEQTTLQPGRPPKADLVFPSPMSESGIPRGAVVFLGVLIGVIAYGAWYSSTVDNDFFKKWIEPVPDRLAALLPGRSEDAAPDRSQAVAAEKPAASGVTGAAPAEPSAEQTEQTGGQTMTAADTPAESAMPAETVPSATPPAEQAAPAMPEAAPETTAAETAADQQAEAAPATVTETPAEPAATPAAEPAPATETADATPAPEPAAAVSETARPPESIAQPVETAELPAPQTDTRAGEPTPAASQDAPADQPQAASEPAAAVPGTATEVANAPADAEARIVLTAVSDSWVEVREMGTDTWVWGKLLRAGETYSVPDRPDLKMKTGNAGGLTIKVDGVSVPPVGASGDVVRNILLDPERLKAGTAVFR